MLVHNIGRYFKIYYSNMNMFLEHVIHMFIARFMQENYHSGDVIFSLFDFRRQGDE